MAGLLYVFFCVLPNGILRGCGFDFELHYVDETLLYQQCLPLASRDDGEGIQFPDKLRDSGYDVQANCFPVQVAWPFAQVDGVDFRTDEDSLQPIQVTLDL